MTGVWISIGELRALLEDDRLLPDDEVCLESGEGKRVYMPISRPVSYLPADERRQIDQLQPMRLLGAVTAVADARIVFALRISGGSRYEPPTQVSEIVPVAGGSLLYRHWSLY